ncbi:MAG: efflux RND transporter permease subunit [Nitratireductor sp.]|nr:efflux RND transporter permease subunit [Nitratireductor sp.]
MPRSRSLISLVARHHNAANLIMVLMILFGVFSLGRINSQIFPTIETDTINITVSWPGASAEDVETNILEIIEPAVRFIDNVDKMHSYAREGGGTIALEFATNTDMQKATSDVESAVKAVTNLPEDAETPAVARWSFFDRVANLSLSGTVPESTLRIYAKKIRDDLIERGVDKVEFTGLRDVELQVKVPESELRRLGLSISEISARVAANSRDLPSGQMEGDVEKQLRTAASYETPRELGEIEVRSLPSGEKIYLKDIADINVGYEDGQKQGYVDGSNAIQIEVSRAPTADTLATAAILDEYLAEMRPTLPPGVTIQKYDVSADNLLARIMLLVRNGIGGLVLVVATLFIFLNARIAFWVAAGIPVAMLATIGVMMLMGQTINMISLFALIMMLGVIVDDAIVVGEHTATRFAEGDGPYEAAENGAGRMVAPVMAAMTTTIAAFAPILLIRDTIGQMMGVMPVVVMAVIISSLIECFFILPGHLAHALEPSKRRRWSYWRQMLVALVIGVFVLSLATRSSVGVAETASPFAGLAALRDGVALPLFIALVAIGSLLVGTLLEALIQLVARFASRRRQGRQKVSLEEENFVRRAFDRGFAKFRDGPFNWLVEHSFHYRYLTLAIAVSISIAVAWGLYIGGQRVGFVFFQSPEAENLNARLEFNAGIRLEEVQRVVRLVEQSLDKTEKDLAPKDERLIAATFSTIGASGRNEGDNLADIRVQLTPSEERTVRTAEIVQGWRKNLPDIPGLKRASISASRGGPPGRDIDMELTGADVATLKRAAGEMIELVSALPGATGVSDDLPFGKPELVMELTPRGNALGFSLEDVARQVRNAFEGSIPRRFAQGDDEVTIRVERLNRQQGTAALRSFELRSSTGEFVPLTEVVTLTERQGFSSIRRQDGKTIVSVTADLDTDILTTEQAISQLEDAGIAQVALRHGVDYRFGGRNEERKKSFEDLRTGVFVALAVIYIILAWTFASYWRPIAIMLIIPFGLVGAIFGHWLLGFKLTIMSFIALLGLAGILVNDSIILVSRLDERLAEGETLFEAATGASRDRLRAVLLTSLTTIGGLVPLMFEKSVQAQFVLPMAATIIFGLGLATLLVLFLVPAIVGVGADIRNLLIAVFSRTGSSTRPAE